MCSLEADGTSKLGPVGTRSETPISGLPFSFFMLYLGFFFFFFLLPTVDTRLGGKHMVPWHRLMNSRMNSLWEVLPLEVTGKRGEYHWWGKTMYMDRFLFGKTKVWELGTQGRLCPMTLMKSFIQVFHIVLTVACKGGLVGVPADKSGEGKPQHLLPFSLSHRNAVVPGTSFEFYNLMVASWAEASGPALASSDLPTWWQQANGLLLIGVLVMACSQLKSTALSQLRGPFDSSLVLGLSRNAQVKILLVLRN